MATRASNRGVRARGSGGGRRGGRGKSGGGESRMPAQLQRAYLTGKVSPRIRWGSGGDFGRCVAQAKVHGMGRMANGACARLHRKATGFWPGRGRNH